MLEFSMREREREKERERERKRERERESHYRPITVIGSIDMYDTARIRGCVKTKHPNKRE